MPLLAVRYVVPDGDVDSAMAAGPVLLDAPADVVPAGDVPVDDVVGVAGAVLPVVLTQPESRMTSSPSDTRLEMRLAVS